MLGRKSEDKLNVESWDQLWKMRGIDMKASGLAVQDRRLVPISTIQRIISMSTVLQVYSMGTREGQAGGAT